MSIITGASLSNVEQAANRALPDFSYRAVPAGISAEDSAANLTAETAWSRPVVWTHLAAAGFSYALEPDGLLHKAAEAFDFVRLDGVHQFDFKCDPYTKLRWPQKRFGHSFDVAAVANLLVHNNASAFSDSDRQAIVLAAFLHDILMPPGGETMKHVDMPAFDEDLRFPAFVESDAFWEFADINGVNSHAVARVMREEDAAGVLKDLADKIGYVCRDIARLQQGNGHMHDVQTPLFHRVRRAFERQPQPGLFWESVMVEHGQVVIHDVDRFCSFLELRALLFSSQYQNPNTRSDGYVYGEVILRWLYETGQLKAESILTMTDEDLDRIIDRHVCWVDGEEITRMAFATRDEAERVQAQWLQAGVIFSTVVDYTRGCKPSTHYLVPTPDGPKPLREAYPQRAEKIRALAEESNRVLLFAIREPKAEFAPGLLKSLTEHRHQR